ncbi:laminin subunit gamma-3-like [Acipenser oxyrinchus oxyrinchus]|uniref:Laminin subunit gamma-3-like n=1 Tax=Acipenser oxyrinchus oxyrinchus TaxID=40147 RepID=A0AAD8FWJ3_ACIOX|nr:laminin subunit gamma-3-like [Acipenser oxyrinchus oxyrinchus]
MGCFLLGLLLPLLSLKPVCVLGAMDSCWDDLGRANRCMPRFENAVFNRTVIASNVCGSPPEDYCKQTGSSKSCHRCDAMHPSLHHNATYLNDFHNDEEPTWWQSQSMFHGVQYPNSVNLTLHLGKSYEISYIRLKFHTSRPESFAIYKRTHEGGSWIPYQYYSATCGKTYKRNGKGYLRPGEDEQQATCTDEFSDISPLTGGNVAFSTLEGRPSAYNFDHSPVLQDWVTATDLLISLNRLNTFGDEFFKDPNVLRSYYYAISDFSVGGRCKCNGHASECVSNEIVRLVCNCQHNTAGPDCEKCQPFFHDRPWARATADSANECLPCNCSSRSEDCHFDAELYRSTGHGGHCVNCRDGTAGPNCERCKENFHRSSPKDVCLPCNCSVVGSSSLQCGGDGNCICKLSVTGEKCDSCQPGHHSLTEGGCRPCACHPAGSVGLCNPLNGQCSCKENVEGYQCDRCKPGAFNRDSQNPAGCTSCFCYGHSAACTSAVQYSAFSITSDFTEDLDGWVGEFLDGSESLLIWKEGEVYLLPYTDEDSGFFKAPGKFLGDKLLSYGQPLSLTFKGESEELLPSFVTLIIEGSGMRMSARLFPQNKTVTDSHPQQTFVFRLHEGQAGQQIPLSSFEFHRLLSNITAIKISNAGGHSYTAQLSEVTLVSAAPGLEPPAPWVEECICPQGYVGQFCEFCAPGYKRETPSGGPFTRCVPCTCNQHGVCAGETGLCQCRDNTVGPTCERCADGFYGNPLLGTSGDCQPCPCPHQSSCAVIPDTGEVVCTDCPPGQRGTRCEMCDDGFHGDPLGARGQLKPCRPCQCSGNVDPNAIGVCDHVTGRCLKCLHNTEGDRCERCKDGYYGNALDQETLDKCKPCNCSPPGSVSPSAGCGAQTGQCECLSHVTGRDCSHCETGFFNLRPGEGCQRCTCNPTGSVSSACHPITGQCSCRPGVEGSACDSCRKGFFSFSARGCRECNCSPMGSVTMQCHGNGTCLCREGFVGYKCDQCKVNYFHSRATHQCEECPVCYGLVRDEAAKLKEKLQALEEELKKYDCQSHRDYEHYPVQREGSLSNSLEDLLAMQNARDAFLNQFMELETSVRTIQERLSNISRDLNCSGAGNDKHCSALNDTGSSIQATQEQLQLARETLDNMVIPHDLPREPNKWTILVNESQVLAVSQKSLADYMESIAKKALWASKQTLSLLSTIVEDHSTESYVRDLAGQFLDMHEAKANLTESVEETLTEAKKAYSSVQRINTEIAEVLTNITDSHREIPLSDAMRNKTEELDRLSQSKEELISKAVSELQPQIDSMIKSMESVQQLAPLTARASESQSLALASVVKGKEVDAEASALLKELEGMKKTWSRKQTQTKVAVKKMRTVKEKIVVDAKKKTKQAANTVTPAVSSSTQANATAREAQRLAAEASADAKAALKHTEKSGRMMTELNSTVSAVLHEVAAQEMKAAELQRGMREMKEIAGNMGDVREDMKTAKRSLESYALVLKDLLAKLETSQVNERFESILNETETQLRILRLGVQSEGLGLRIQTLQEAARQQESQMKEMEKDIAEILEEKINLEDIVQNFPEGCFNRPQTGRR